MKNQFLFLTLLSTCSLFSQSEVLNKNQVRAKINANGILFTEGLINQASYEIPKEPNGSGAHVIFSSSFSFGAVDPNGTIHMAASSYTSSPKDLFSGPIATNYSNQTYIDKYNHVYTVTATEIHDHQINWSNPNYVIPIDILNWPGNGNTANGEASILAPFIDYNANNLYEPLLGDHPYIRGDKAAYFILNDLAEPHALTQSDPLGMEFHYMIYQFETNDFLDTTTFINIKVINRSQNNYNQFIAANYTDFDIGGSQDDHIGSSSSKNMVFGYNDANDNAASGGEALFGTNPPASAIKILSHQMGASTYYTNAGGTQGDPSTTSDFWNYMNGNWPDGTSFTMGGNGYGGTIPTNYVFDGNPNDTSLWTEISESFVSGDRRAFMATEPVSNFGPGDYICYDFAVLYSRTGGNNLLNLNGLFDVADSVQAFYDTQPYFYCEPLLLGKEEVIIKREKPTIFPNPAQNYFKVQLSGTYDLDIYSISGKIIASLNEVNSNQNILTPNEAGIYLVKIKKADFSKTLKLIVE